MVSITAKCEGSVHPQIHYNLKEFSSHSVPVWRRGSNEPQELIPFLWVYEAGLSSYMLLIRRKVQRRNELRIPNPHCEQCLARQKRTFYLTICYKLLIF